MNLRIFLTLMGLLALSACSTTYDHRPIIYPRNFTQLPGWEEAKLQTPYRMFAQACQKTLARSNPFATKNGQAIGSLSAWARSCHIANLNPNASEAEARQFFESQFIPHRVTTRYSEYGRFTGYYEPVLQGSYTKSTRFSTPVYAVPTQPQHRNYSRKQIDAGALQDKAKILLYVDDPVMLFFMHIQGSGKVQLPDGRLTSLQYAGQNGHEYTAIGRVLRDQGELEEVNLQTIRDWLYNHPEQQQGILQQNPSYIYFNRVDTAAYPKGALGVPLTPGHSLAVDDEQTSYGIPIFIATETNLPEEDGRAARTRIFTTAPDNQTIQRLMIAEDTGGAILGAHRGDIFFGRGKVAEAYAGYQNSQGQAFWLIPKTVMDARHCGTATP